MPRCHPRCRRRPRARRPRAATGGRPRRRPRGWCRCEPDRPGARNRHLAASHGAPGAVRPCHAAGHRCTHASRSRVRLAAAQSAYYLVTGALPFVSMRAFEAATGPKREHWLVRAVGLLALGFGGVLARDAARRRPDPTVGIAGAVPFAAREPVVRRHGPDLADLPARRCPGGGVRRRVAARGTGRRQRGRPPAGYGRRPERRVDSARSPTRHQRQRQAHGCDQAHLYRRRQHAGTGHGRLVRGARGAVRGLGDCVLVDLDPERLAVVTEIGRRMARARGADLRITATTDRAAGLADADVVLTSFRPGGFEARALDERLPLRHGVIGQETQGPGGFFMALRSIHVMRDIVADIERVAPGAKARQLHQPGQHRVRGRDPPHLDSDGLAVRGSARLPGRRRSQRGAGSGPARRDAGRPRTTRAGPSATSTTARTSCRSSARRRNGGPPRPSGDRRADRMLALAAAMGSLPSAYLWYYYFRDEALDEARTAPTTRAEDILAEVDGYWAHYREQAAAAEPVLDPARSRGGILELRAGGGRDRRLGQRHRRDVAGQRSQRRWRAAGLSGRPRRGGAGPRRAPTGSRPLPVPALPREVSGADRGAGCVPGAHRRGGVVRDPSGRRRRAGGAPARAVAHPGRGDLRRDGRGAPRVAAGPAAAVTDRSEGFLLGVDGGNTKTLALVATPDGTIVGTGRAVGCADIYAAPVDEAMAVVAAGGRSRPWWRLPSRRGTGDRWAAFSMAGADWPEDVVELEPCSAHGCPTPVRAVNDAVGALRAAIPDGPGVVVVAGTGVATGARGPDGGCGTRASGRSRRARTSWDPDAPRGLPLGAGDRPADGAHGRRPRRARRAGCRGDPPSPVAAGPRAMAWRPDARPAAAGRRGDR